MKRFADNGSALDREDRASRDAGAVEIVTASTVGSRNGTTEIGHLQTSDLVIGASNSVLDLVPVQTSTDHA